MHICVNGVSTDIRAPEGGGPLVLLHVLLALGYATADGKPAGSFVVALNQHIVTASLYASTLISEGDGVDILGAITGG